MRVLNTIPVRAFPDAVRSGFLLLALRTHPWVVVRYAALRALWMVLNRLGVRHPLQTPAWHE